MIERTERDLDSSPNVSPPTRTAPASSSAGSSAPASGRKSLSGTRVLVTTAPSRVPTSRSIRNAMSMSVPRATCSRPPAASAPTCPALSGAQARLRTTAQAAVLSEDAITQGHTRRQRRCPWSSSLADGDAGVARRSRCVLPTWRRIAASSGCAFGACQAHATRHCAKP